MKSTIGNVRTLSLEAVSSLITERLRENLRILFIGFNPSLTSYERGFNYAGRNNRFYRILYESGLTDRLYSPEESPALLDDYNYGFTNIVSRPTKRADELTKEDYAEGRIILREKLARYQPDIACYVGKGVYAEFTLRRTGVEWGFQPDSQVQNVRDFVAPATSGLVRMTMKQQVELYQPLAKALP